MSKTHVVACVIKHQGEILILKRSEEVDIYKSKWSGVSGHVKGRKPREAAYGEVKDETGLRKIDLKLVRELDPIEFRGGGRDWAIHVYLFKSKTKNIRIKSEHTDYRWVAPEEVDNYDTVPKFRQVLDILEV